MSLVDATGAPLTSEEKKSVPVFEPHPELPATRGYVMQTITTIGQQMSDHFSAQARALAGNQDSLKATLVTVLQVLEANGMIKVESATNETVQ